MKAEELMIGDWVKCNYYSDKPCYIQFGIGDFQKLGYEYCEPIPLTTEILEKNGFIYDDMPFVQAWVQYGLTIYENRINCGQNVSMKVQFVHELQHALRLCGIEKEIIL